MKRVEQLSETKRVEQLSETTWQYFFWRAAFRMVFKSMGLEIAGLGNVPRTGPLIVASNHRSHADPPLVGACLPRSGHFMGKRELFEVPIFSPIIRKTGAFPVTRGRPDRRAMRYAIQALANGEVVVMFPEGTRSEDARLKEPELGVAMIALKSRAPVLPVAVAGTEHILPKGSTVPRGHPLKVRFGRPLTFDDLYEARPSRPAMVEIGDRLMGAIGDLLRPLDA